MDGLWIIVLVACFILIITIVIVIVQINSKKAMQEMQVEGFEEFYNNLINSNNDELYLAWDAANRENVKRKRIATMICSIVDAIIVLALVIPYFIEGEGNNFLGGIISALAFVLISNLFIFLILKVVYNKETRNYQKIYKKNVISNIINSFYSDLEYLPNSEMPENVYRNLKYERYDKYKSEDYFTAKINNKYNLEMAEVVTQETEEMTDSEGNITTTEKTVFHGLFAKINVNKRIIEELRIMPNGELFFYSKNRKITMDSGNFEKYFDVATSDKIVTMQLFTADVMEELVEMRKTLGIIFDIIIRNNQLYLRFHLGTIFEPGTLKTKGFDKDLIKQYYYALKVTYTIANKLIDIIENTQL